MIVLHFCSNKNWRGGEQQVTHLLNGFSGTFEKFLFCPKGSELEKRNQNSSRVYCFEKRAGVDIIAAFTLKNVCNKINADLIHIHDSHSLNTYILAKCLGLSVPCVVHRHVNFKVSNFWKYKIPGIKKIICVSDAVRNNFNSIINDSFLTVIHPAISVNVFEVNSSDISNKYGISKNRIIVGTVSALEKEKNIEEFIEIAKSILLKSDNYCFIIYGEGSLKERLQDQIHREKLEKKILLLGFQENIPKALKGLDIFLFTSKNEGFPLVLLEAMAAGIPIITTGSGGIKNMITSTYNGLIYPLGDIKEAVQQLEYVCLNPSFTTELTKNALEYVKQFDVPLMHQKIEALYKEILSL